MSESRRAFSGTAIFVFHCMIAELDSVVHVILRYCPVLTFALENPFSAYCTRVARTEFIFMVIFHAGSPQEVVFVKVALVHLSS